MNWSRTGQVTNVGLDSVPWSKGWCMIAKKMVFAMIATHQVLVYASFNCWKFNCSEGGREGEKDACLCFFFVWLTHATLYTSLPKEIQDHWCGPGLHLMERFQNDFSGKSWSFLEFFFLILSHYMRFFHLTKEIDQVDWKWAFKSCMKV